MPLALMRIWSLISATGIIWKVVRNYRVLHESTTNIADVINAVVDEGKKLPSQEQAILLAQAFSNILKTGIIDIPGVDEHELMVSLDALQSNMAISVQDSQTGKYYNLAATKKDLKL